MKSPQSNVLSDALVHTRKHDHVRVKPLPNVKAALLLMDG